MEKLIIELMPDGGVSVTGPIGKKGLCYGMLEMAKEAIQDYNRQQQPRLVQASSMPADIFRKEQ
jgi:hypothetical protein